MRRDFDMAEDIPMRSKSLVTRPLHQRVNGCIDHSESDGKTCRCPKQIHRESQRAASVISFVSKRGARSSHKMLFNCGNRQTRKILIDLSYNLPLDITME